MEWLLECATGFEGVGHGVEYGLGLLEMRMLGDVIVVIHSFSFTARPKDEYM